MADCALLNELHGSIAAYRANKSLFKLLVKAREALSARPASEEIAEACEAINDVLVGLSPDSIDGIRLRRALTILNQKGK